MYRKRYQSWRKHLDFILLDFICLQAACILAYFLRHGNWGIYQSQLYRDITIVISFISIAATVLFDFYSGVLTRGFYNELVITLRHVIVVIAAVIAYLYATKDGGDYSRITLVTTGVLYFVFSYITRILWKSVVKKRVNSVNARTLLAVATKATIEDCIKDIEEGCYAGYQVVGLALLGANENESKAFDTSDSVKIIATESNMIEYICNEWVDEVLIDLGPGETLPKEIANELLQIGVVIHEKIARESSLVGRKQFVEYIGEMPVLTSTMNYISPGRLFLKRMMDIAGGLVGCVLTGVAFIFIAPVIMVQSPGPVFFTQERVGQNGKHFKIHKFRTMYLDAEERKKELMEQNTIKDGMMFKLDFDPRIIGNKVKKDGSYKRGIMDFMRRVSVDELPQFYDVLIGNMSLVGTRPPTVDEVKKYSTHHHARLAAKPGITGMWQVSGRSNITDFEEVVRLDTEYINNWNIGLDIKILFKTIAVVFKGEGAK